MIKRCYGCKRFQAVAHALTLQLEICQRTEQKEVSLFKSLGWILQDQLHTEQKVTKMERHISFCSHVVLQEHLSGVITKPDNGGIHSKLEATDCKKRET